MGVTFLSRIELIGTSLVLNILIIDDHELFRDGITLLLESLNEISTVRAVATGTEALAEVELNRDYDIVLLDYNLPDMSGIDTLKKFKSSTPEIPIVMLSAEELPERIEGAMKEGASGFITKSSSSQVMISAIKLVLSGGMYLPPQLLFAGRKNNTKTQQEPNFDPKRTLGINVNQRKVEELPHSEEPLPSRPSLSAELFSLTDRQQEVLVQMSNGFSNKEIAKLLNMSPSTVKVHASAIFREFGVNNRVQAITKAKKHNFLDEE